MQKFMQNHHILFVQCVHVIENICTELLIALLFILRKHYTKQRKPFQYDIQRERDGFQVPTIVQVQLCACNQFMALSSELVTTITGESYPKSSFFAKLCISWVCVSMPTMLPVCNRGFRQILSSYPVVPLQGRKWYLQHVQQCILGSPTEESQKDVGPPKQIIQVQVEESYLYWYDLVKPCSN